MTFSASSESLPFSVAAPFSNSLLFSDERGKMSTPFTVLAFTLPLLLMTQTDTSDFSLHTMSWKRCSLVGEHSTKASVNTIRSPSQTLSPSLATSPKRNTLIVAHGAYLAAFSTSSFNTSLQSFPNLSEFFTGKTLTTIPDEIIQANQIKTDKHYFTIFL